MEATPQRTRPKTVGPDVWLDCFRRIAYRQRRAVFGVGRRPAVRETTGAGGDVTLSIDRLAEEIVFEEIAGVCRGFSVVVVSEERGEARVGSGTTLATLVIDPLDGSNNAARGLAPHALSIAVASGETFDEVVLAYVADVAAGHEIVRVVGSPPLLDRSEVDCRRAPGPPMVALEYGTPKLFEAVASALPCETVRVIGSSAIALSYVGLGRFDGFVTGWGVRCVDIAAAMSVARAGGATVAIRRARPDSSDFSLSSRFQVAAAHDPDLLDRLLALEDSSHATILAPTRAW